MWGKCQMYKKNSSNEQKNSLNDKKNSLNEQKNSLNEPFIFQQIYYNLFFCRQGFKL